MAAATEYTVAVSEITAWEEKLDKADVRPFPDEAAVKKAKAELAKLEKRADAARKKYDQAKSAFIKQYYSVIDMTGAIPGMNKAKLFWFE